MSKNGRSKKWNVAHIMPPLRHSKPGEEFCPANSDVVRWLIKQPEIMQVVFEAVKNREIIYDPETRTWRGADYEA